jgi:Na+/proline symporter/signal transduction histidine kinase/CheY-like chemotaxis protein
VQGWPIFLAAIAYVTLLFIVASVGDRNARRTSATTPRPYIYALSLAIYCTSWTFFGSVGLASEHGFDFLSIYIGPIIIFVFGFPLLKRLIRLVKAERITSIADFLAARYGKSFAVASIATLIGTIGTIPYIALQLRSISGSVDLMVTHYHQAATSTFPLGDAAFSVAFMLAVFAMLFGTRHADATEHQDGLVLAMAVESVVKLLAFLAVGVTVMFFLADRPTSLIEAVRENQDVQAALNYHTSLTSWLVMTGLSAAAVIMLPRQFYIMIVENRSEDELRKAAWVFPLYLVAINIFVIPIAFAGLTHIGDATSADLYVLALPLSHDRDIIAMIAFIGGLSAATAMVIVASVALSIMISNDLVIPLFLRRLLRPELGDNEDWSKMILTIRRIAIFVILFAAFLYHRGMPGDVGLVSIGLISFAAIAQFIPPFVGGLLWRGANARGAALGMAAGGIIWAYTLFIPSILPHGTEFLLNGPFGIAMLKPQALFGTVAAPLNHGVLWSLALNTTLYVLGSLSRASKPRERIQASIFVPREAGPVPAFRRSRTTITVNDIKDTISRYLGVERTERSFQSFEEREGHPLPGNAPASMAAIRFSEQLLASAVGSSSARLILSLLIQRNDGSMKDAFRLLDDASDALQHNRDLLQIALDQMEQGITVFDKDLRLTCWNRQYRALFDLPDELGQVGISLAQILTFLARRGDILQQQEAETLDRLTTFGQSWQLALRGGQRIIELRSNPMPDGGVVATYADITARVKADAELKRINETLEQRVTARTGELTRVNEELAQAQKIAEEANLGKTRFLAAAGHDILQPLNAARLYCSSLIEKAGAGEASEAARNIESSLESVETILGMVLDISRLDTGALKPSETVFRLDELLQQIATDFQPMAEAKRLRLTTVPSSLMVRTDRNMLRRLVQNLVSNAIKYTRSGRILVGVRRRGELVEIQVFDSGIGIPEDKLNAVFREFTRLDEGVREAPGLGLGLSIVDRIARVLRLELHLESVKGKGTRFSVILPRTHSAPQAAVGEPAQGSGPIFALSGLSVLCIDNDPRIVEGMRLLLEGWGCVVRTAAGSAVLDEQASLPPDVILADYHLDGEDGLELIARLRSRHGRDTPALLLTADRSEELKAMAARMEVGVLNKPVKPAALRAMLSRYRKVLSAAE